MKLTSCQLRALKILIKWYHGSNTIAVLQGNAGTGKTTLVKVLLENLPNVKPLVLAPFNEAVKQLERNLGSKYDLKTVCKALNYGRKLEGEEFTLTQLTKPNLSAYNLLIIDEASTLSDELLTAIEDLHMYTLFIGHKSQLPPVEPTQSKYDKCISPVFTRDYITVDLVEAVRHTGELAAFCNTTESLIYKMGLVPKQYQYTEAQAIKYVRSNEGMELLFAGDLKFIAWTNNRVEYFNKLSRDILFANPTDSFVIDDRVVLYSPALGYQLPTPDYLSFHQLLKRVSELYTVNTKGVVTKVGTKTICNVLCWELTVKTDCYIDSFKLAVFYTPITREDYYVERAKYLRRATYAKDAERNKKWAELYTFDTIFADIKHGYAITCHKSQGSSIHTVVVDDTDIDKCDNSTLRAKLRYVAYSRTKEKLIRIK